MANGLLMARCEGRCEWCGDPFGGRIERHHRQRRRDGGDRLANIVALDADCHRYLTEHPAEATEAGFIVSAFCLDVMDVPIRLRAGDWRGDWFLLDDEGTTTPTAEPWEASA